MSESNAVRWRPDDRSGHIESFFLKANAPGDGRGVWFRFTLLSPVGRPHDARAEVWAVVFDRRAGAPRAWKASGPASVATVSGEQLGVAASGCLLSPGRTTGALRSPAGDIDWDLRWGGSGDELRLLSTSALYENRRFPRTKLVSPEPDARFDGFVRAGDTHVEVRDWPGMQGHNWGLGHAWRYAWGHVNAFAGHPGTVLEGVSAAVRVGALTTPLLTIALLRHAGHTFDFRGARHWWNRSAHIEPGRWGFAAVSADARIDVLFESRPDDTAGLVYEDPDGARAICLNSELARCRVDLALREGRRFGPGVVLLCEDAAALEVLSRDGAYGVPVIA